MTSALISKTSNYSVFLFSLSQMEPGLWFFSSLSVSVGRLKPLSRHQPAFGLGKANESRLHSSLANKSPVKLCILLVRSFSQGRYIFMGIYNFLPSRETSPFTLIKSGVIFTTKHLTCSHLAKNTCDTWAWKNLQALEGQIQQTRLTQFFHGSRQWACL